MTTDQAITHPFSLGLDQTQFGLRLKSPKVLVGPLELGLAATYSLSDPTGEEGLVSMERFKPSLTVKDVFLRGKFELEATERSLHYSKKFRAPFFNTDLVKLRLTAKLPPASASSGLLGRALGLTVTFTTDGTSFCQPVAVPPPATSSSSAAPGASGASRYDLDLAPRLGPPQIVYDKIGFPGSVYFKAKTTLQLTDATSVSGLRAHLDVHSFNAVIRLYDPSRVKPCRVGRNLARAARRLTAEDVGSEEEAAHGVQVTRGSVSAQSQPDIIDRLAAKGREWAHAVFVNSCVATRNLQDKAAETADVVRAYVSSATAGTGGSSSSPAKHGGAAKH